MSPDAGLATLVGGFALLALSLPFALRRARPGRPTGAGWPARAVGAVAGIAAFAFGCAALRALGVDARFWQPDLALAGVVGALAARAARSQRWRPSGGLALGGLALAVLGYVEHAALVSLPAFVAQPHSLHSLLLSILLFLVETTSLVLVVVHAFYALDACSRAHWRRAPSDLPFDAALLPKVAVQVTTFNEPPELVEATLDALSRLDYPPERLLVMALDDSTDEASRSAVERACRRHGFWHVTRDVRRGFKAGAMNHANALLPPDVEIVAIVDADYVVDRAWLRETTGFFADPRVAFVQTPQAYRNADESFLTRQYDAQDAYFYGSVMPSRNDANSIIFCGTMGLVRLSALRAAGGWSESHICEDAELSLRLLEAGGHAVYLPKIYGRGLIPSTFGAYKRQQYRWAFGNVRIAIDHERLLRRGRLRARQKLDYLMGLLHWFDGLALMGIAGSLAVLGFAYAFGWNVVSHHRGEAWIVALVPLALMLETSLRLHSALGRAGKVSVARTLAVFGLWSAIKLNNARAALNACLGRDAAFERTPKDRGERMDRWARARQAAREARREAIAAGIVWAACAAALARLALVGVSGQQLVDVLALAAWLALYGVMLSTAPAYAYAALAPPPAARPAVAPVSWWRPRRAPR